MSIPTLLVCDGSESRQEVLEKLIKGEPGLKYLATVGSQNGASAVDQALKIGGRLVWFDLDDEVDNVVTLMNEVKTLFPQAVMVASVTTVTPEIASIAEHIGVAALLYPQNFYEQVKALVAFLNGQGSAPGAGTAAAAAPAAAPAPAPATAVAQTPVTAGPGQEESKWGNLDSIPTPKANIKEQEATGEINVVSMRPNLDVTASANQAKQDIQAAVNTQQEGGSKWGDLDSIGSPQARATAPETQALPVAPARTPAPQPAPVQASAPAPAPAPAPTPAPASAPAATPSNGNQAESGNKWGDLDAIPTPKAVTKEVSFSPDDTPKPVAPPPPLPPPRPKGDNTLRPSPTKAEMYNMPSTPAWFIAVILLVIMACVGYVYYSRMHH
ncbi:MAG: hypothetical protein QG625_2001 [Cyanobacteriota bacterium erpe_2018_sw_39hr_WHONDRS-SW48-000098_B_bin.30]|nr:hypothetical protein [Cyanobacteriota bacterium erpe_2018_sw_39hr_WHONDRS-SW48-000098_B_bin.30]